MEWSDDDFDVLVDGIVVGRIFKVKSRAGRHTVDVGDCWRTGFTLPAPRSQRRWGRPPGEGEVSTGGRVDHATICGRSCANSEHCKSLCACVDRTFVNFPRPAKAIQRSVPLVARKATTDGSPYAGGSIWPVSTAKPTAEIPAPARRGTKVIRATPVLRMIRAIALMSSVWTATRPSR
jgi:hypothetical protein